MTIDVIVSAVIVAILAARIVRLHTERDHLRTRLRFYEQYYRATVKEP